MGQLHFEIVETDGGWLLRLFEDHHIAETRQFVPGDAGHADAARAGSRWCDDQAAGSWVLLRD